MPYSKCCLNGKEFSSDEEANHAHVRQYLRSPRQCLVTPFSGKHRRAEQSLLYRLRWLGECQNLFSHSNQDTVDANIYPNTTQAYSSTLKLYYTSIAFTASPIPTQAIRLRTRREWSILHGEQLENGSKSSERHFLFDIMRCLISSP